MSDWTTFGVSFRDEGQIRRITAPLDGGDSRSERIRNLTRDGLAVERGLSNAGVDGDRVFADRAEREQWISDVVREAAAELRSAEAPRR